MVFHAKPASLCILSLLLAVPLFAQGNSARERAAFKLLDANDPDSIEAATWALQDCYTPENLKRLRSYTTDSFSITRKPLNWPLSIERAQTRFYPRRAVAYTVGRILWNQEMPGPPIEETQPRYRDLPRKRLLVVAGSILAIVLLIKLVWRRFRILTALSTMLALILAFFWIRSFRHYDNFIWSVGGEQYEIATTIGNVSICRLRDGADPFSPRISSLTSSPTVTPWRKGWLYLAEPRTCWWPQRNQGSIINTATATNLFAPTGTFQVDDIPYWMVLTPFMVLPVCYVIGPARARDRARRWARAGRCPGCGYDLRATPASCPECGWTEGA